MGQIVETVAARCQQTLPASDVRSPIQQRSKPAKQQLCDAITALLETIHSIAAWAHHLDCVSLSVPCFERCNKTSAAPIAATSSEQPADMPLAAAPVINSRPTEFCSGNFVA